MKSLTEEDKSSLLHFTIGNTDTLTSNRTTMYKTEVAKLKEHIYQCISHTGRVSCVYEQVIQSLWVSIRSGRRLLWAMGKQLWGTGECVTEAFRQSPYHLLSLPHAPFSHLVHAKTL